MTDPRVVTTPHDHLVRRVLMRPAAAAVILRRVLPRRLLDRLDLSRIQIEPTTFIDPRLGRRSSDLIYSVGVLGSDHCLEVFIAIEHQSTPSPLLALRMLWYLAWLWERYLSSNPRARRIPLIIPIVLVQCPTKWNGPNQLSELFDLPDELRDVLPPPVELRLLVDDMSESVLDDPVAEPDVLALVELTRSLLFAYHQPGSFTPERIAVLAPLFDTVLRSNREDAMALWTYVITVFDHDSPVRAMLLAAVGRENKTMCATIKETWLAEGVAKGVARGLSNALLQVLEHRQLAASSDVRARVLTMHDEPTLQRWFQRALTADTLGQVFEQ